MNQAESITSDRDRITVRAFDYASSYDVRTARDVLEKEFAGKSLVANPLLVQFEPRRMVVVSDYGAIVFFNFTNHDTKNVIEKLKKCAQRPNTVVSEDEFVLYLAPRQRMPEGTDELHIREFNRDIALLVSIVLSRSVSIEYYEAQVADALAKLEQTISTLSRQGKIPRNPRALTRQVGFALSVEHELAYALSVFDDPEVVWDGGARIEDLYKSLKLEFDLEDRIRILQQKVSLISRSSTFIISRLEGQRAQVLEWIIIILILSEIILALFGRI
jgi:uncharacterized Rmd1/YagE family protein